MSGQKIPSTVMGTTVAEVYTRPVSTKYGDKTIWTVVTPDGTKWESWKADVGNIALGLKGQVVDLKVEIEQKGDYTNYNLIRIRPAAGPAVAEAAQTAQAAQPQAVSYEQYKSLDKEKEDRKQESIHRQVAAKVAAVLTTPEDGAAGFWVNLEAILHFFQTGEIPGGTSVTSHTASNTLSTGANSSGFGLQTDFVPSDTYNHQDDDIPF